MLKNLVSYKDFEWPSLTLLKRSYNFNSFFKAIFKIIVLLCHTISGIFRFALRICNKNAKY